MFCTNYKIIMCERTIFKTPMKNIKSLQTFIIIIICCIIITAPSFVCLFYLFCVRLQLTNFVSSAFNPRTRITEWTKWMCWYKHWSPFPVETCMVFTHTPISFYFISLFFPNMLRSPSLFAYFLKVELRRSKSKKEAHANRLKIPTVRAEEVVWPHTFMCSFFFYFSDLIALDVYTAVSCLNLLSWVFRY